MKVNFNQKVKDHRGKEVDIVISEKLSELMWFAGSQPEIQFSREDMKRSTTMLLLSLTLRLKRS